MLAHSPSRLPRWLGVVSVLGGSWLLGHSLHVWLGGEPVLPILLAWVLGSCAMVGPLWALWRGSSVERALALGSLVGFTAHLLLLGPALVVPPPAGEEMRSLFLAGLGQVIGGFPVRATVALLGVLAWSALVRHMLPPGRAAFLVAGALAGIGTILILSYATGSLLPFIP